MRNVYTIIALLFFAVGCGSVSNPFDKSVEEEEGVDMFAEVYDNLVSKHLHNGYIVSRNPDGSTQHEGEGVLWLGVAAGALPCDKAGPFIDKLTSIAIDNGGYWERFDPLGEDYEHRPINFDGMAGIYFGIAGYISRCGIDAGTKQAWEVHRGWLAMNNGSMHPDVPAKYPSFFDSVPTAIDYTLGHRTTAPHPDALKLTSSAATAWSGSVVASKSACYRIHLSYLQIKALEMMGTPISDAGRDAFCRATGVVGKPEETAIDIPLVDHYCGREGLEQYLDNFKPNEWEMRHQRCGLWENPDGNGLDTPGLDYLVAYSEFYDVN